MQFSLLKPVAIGLTVVYFATSCVFAYAPESNFWVERKRHVRTHKNSSDNLVVAGLPRGANPSDILSQLPALSSQRIISALPEQLKKNIPKSFEGRLTALLESIPYEFGTVRQVLIPQGKDTGKTIIHIQDIHMNQEAQGNIGKVLQSLIDGRKVDLVGLEGAFESIDLSPFRSFEPKDIIRDVADGLLEEKKISGPMHMALTSPVTVPNLIGVDDRTHYEANVQAYRMSEPLMKGYEDSLLEQAHALAKKKEMILNRHLLSFDRQVQLYREGRLPLGDYLVYLAKISKVTSPDVKVFLDALDIETNLNFKQVERERNEIIQRLTERLDQDEMKELFNLSLEYRLGRTGYSDFYRYLTELCQKNGVLLANYKAMESYLRYVLLTERIQAKEILEGIKAMEEDAYERFSQTDEEKKLIFQSNFDHLVGKLIHFALTLDEWTDYLELKKMLTSSNLNPLPLQTFENFYSEAKSRDLAMTKNLIMALEKAKAGTAVLVTGGFHASGIDAALKESGFTVLAFVPRLTSLEGENGTLYLSVFTQEKTPLEKLVAGEKLFVSMLQWSPALQRLAARDVVATAEGRDLHADTPDADDKRVYSRLAGENAGPIEIRASDKPPSHINLIEINKETGSTLIETFVVNQKGQIQGPSQVKRPMIISSRIAAINFFREVINALSSSMMDLVDQVRADLSGLWNERLLTQILRFGRATLIFIGLISFLTLTQAPIVKAKNIGLDDHGLNIQFVQSGIQAEPEFHLRHVEQSVDSDGVIDRAWGALVLSPIIITAEQLRRDYEPVAGSQVSNSVGIALRKGVYKNRRTVLDDKGRPTDDFVIIKTGGRTYQYRPNDAGKRTQETAANRYGVAVPFLNGAYDPDNLPDTLPFIPAERISDLKGLGKRVLSTNLSRQGGKTVVNLTIDLGRIAMPYVLEIKGRIEPSAILGRQDPAYKRAVEKNGVVALQPAVISVRQLEAEGWNKIATSDGSRVQYSKAFHIQYPDKLPYDRHREMPLAPLYETHYFYIINDVAYQPTTSKKADEILAKSNLEWGAYFPDWLHVPDPLVALPIFPMEQLADQSSYNENVVRLEKDDGSGRLGAVLDFNGVNIPYVYQISAEDRTRQSNLASTSRSIIRPIVVQTDRFKDSEPPPNGTDKENYYRINSSVSGDRITYRRRINETNGIPVYDVIYLINNVFYQVDKATKNRPEHLAEAEATWGIAYPDFGSDDVPVDATLPEIPMHDLYDHTKMGQFIRSVTHEASGRITLVLELEGRTVSYIANPGPAAKAVKEGSQNNQSAEAMLIRMGLEPMLVPHQLLVNDQRPRGNNVDLYYETQRFDETNAIYTRGVPQKDGSRLVETIHMIDGKTYGHFQSVGAGSVFGSGQASGSAVKNQGLSSGEGTYSLGIDSLFAVENSDVGWPIQRIFVDPTGKSVVIAHQDGRVEKFSDFLFNQQTGLWVPSHIEQSQEKVIFEVRELKKGADGRPIHDVAGGTTYDVYSRVTFGGKPPYLVHRAQEVRDSKGRLLSRELIPEDGGARRIQYFDVTQENGPYDQVGRVMVEVPLKTIIVNKNGQEELIHSYSVDIKKDATGAPILLIVTETTPGLPQSRRTTIFERKPWIQLWGDQVTGYSDWRPRAEIRTDQKGSSRILFKYNRLNVQHEHLRLEFDASGGLLANATSLSKVLLDAQGRPVVEMALMRQGSHAGQQVPVITVHVENALGETYEDQLNLHGRLQRRFIGHMAGGQFESSRRIDDAIVPARWTGANFVKEVITEFEISQKSANAAVDARLLGTPIPQDSWSYRIEPNGSYLDGIVEKKVLISVSLNSTDGDVEYVSQHYDLVDGGQVENNVWQSVINDKGNALRHFEGYSRNGQFVPIAITEFQPGFVMSTVPSEWRIFRTNDAGERRGDAVVEGTLAKGVAVYQAGEELFGMKLPVSVILYQIREVETGILWQEARDLKGRIVLRAEGSLNSDGAFVPEMRFYSTYEPMPEEDTKGRLIRRPSVMTHVDVHSMPGFANESSFVPVISSSYFGMEQLPEGHGLIGKYGVVTESNDSLTGAVTRELRDTRELVAVRWNGYKEQQVIEGQPTTERFVETSRVYYRYFSGSEAENVPFGTPYQIEIKQDEKTVRLLQYQHTENGHLVYRVLFDSLEYGLRYVGFGKAGWSFEDRQFRESPSNSRVYKFRDIPVYSTTEDIQGEESLWRVYHLFSRVDSGEKLVAIVKEQPRTGLRGPLGSIESRLNQLLESEANILGGPIVEALKNGVVLFRQDGYQKISTGELSEWNVLDHWLSSPSGWGFRPFLVPDINEMNLSRLRTDSRVTQPVDSDRLIPQRLKNPGEAAIARATQYETRYYINRYMAPFGAFIGYIAVFLFLLAPAIRQTWWRKEGAININSASEETLRAIPGMTIMSVGRIMAFRRDQGPFISQQDLEDKLRRSGLTDLLPLLVKNKKRIAFGGEANVTEADISGIKMALTGLSEKSLDEVLGSLTEDEVLFPLAPIMLNFHRHGLLTKFEIQDVIQKSIQLLQPGVVARTKVAGNISANLIRAAYWENISSAGGRLKPLAAHILGENLVDLFQQMGMSGPELRAFIDDVIIKEFSGLGFNAEEILDEGLTPIIGKSGIVFPINRGGIWVLTSFEDEAIKKLIRREIPFISAQSSYEEFLLQEMAALFANGKEGNIPELIKNHQDFLYKLMKIEMDKWEKMRDIRNGKAWDYVMSWEELSEVFRYLLGKTEWGFFPLAWQNDSDFQRARHSAMSVFEQLRPGGQGYQDINIETVAKEKFSPLIKNIRARLGIAKFETPQNQAIFTLRPLYLLLTNGSYWRRFLGDHETGAALHTRLAGLFWVATGLAGVIFVGWLGYYVLVTLQMLPIPVSLNLVLFSIPLPEWAQWTLIAINILPLGDAAILTYLSIVNIGKAIVAYIAGRHYHISDVKTWGQARKALAKLLVNTDCRESFELFLHELYDMPPAKGNLMQLISTGNVSNQHWLTTHEKVAFDEVIRKARNGSLVPADVPERLAIWRTQERIKSWINKQYRQDMPLAPGSYDELKSFTIQISGWGEDFWYDWPALTGIDLQNGATEHRLGMVARSYKDEWIVLVDRLHELGHINTDEKSFLLNLAKKTDEDLASLSLNEAARDLLMEWANDHLGTGYHNIKGVLLARKVYRHYIMKFFPQAPPDEIERMVDEKLQFIVKHDNVASQLDEKLGGQLGQVLRQLRANPDVDLSPYLSLFAEPADFPAALKSKDQIRMYLVFLAANNVELHWWKKGVSDVHGSKYTQWANLFPYVRGEITMALDWDHGHFFEELFVLPNVGREFDINPKLAVAPFKSNIFTKPNSLVGKAMGMSEDGWLGHEQRAKQEIGALAFYGKAFYRTQFYRDLDVLNGEFAAEDVETGVRFLTYGLSTKHIDYLTTGKGLPTDYTGSLTPLRKWSGGTPEAAMSATTLKFLLSPKAHWTKKVDTIISYAHFLKKPRVVRYIVWLSFLHYAFPFNPLSGLTLSLVVAGVILGQAVNYSPMYTRWEEHGILKGTLLFLFVDMPFSLAPFFMGMIVHFQEAVERGFRKNTEFIPTMGKGAVTRRATFKEVYIINSRVIETGAFTMLFAIILSPFDFSRLLIWFMILCVVTSWTFGPFYFNPKRSFGSAWSLHRGSTPLTRFSKAIMESSNIPHMLFGFGLAVIGLMGWVIVLPLTLIELLTGGRVSPVKGYARRIWSELKSYSSEPSLDIFIKEEIKNYAFGFFSGIRAYSEGKMWRSPSLVYMAWMAILAKRARVDLNKKNVHVQKTELENIRLQKPMLAWRIIDSLPLIDWLAIFVPSARDVFWGMGVKLAAPEDVSSRPIGVLTRKVVFAGLYMLYLPLHPFVLIYNAVSRLREMFIIRDEQSKLSENRVLDSSVTSLEPPSDNSIRLNMPLVVGVLAILVLGADKLDPFFLRILVGGLLSTHIILFIYSGKRTKIAIDAVGGRAISLFKTVEGFANTVVRERIFRKSNVNDLARLIVDLDVAMAGKGNPSAGDIIEVIKDVPLNLHGRTNLMGPEGGSYMSFRRDEINHLVSAIAQERRSRRMQILPNVARSRAMLLALDGKSFISVLDERNEMAKIRAVVGEGDLLYAPKPDQKNSGKNDLSILIKAARSMEKDGALYLAGTENLMKQMRLNLQKQGIERRIEIIPCEGAYVDGMIDVDRILMAFSKEHSQNLNSVTFAIFNRDFRLTEQAALSFNEIKVLLLEENGLGFISGVQCSLEYLLGLNSLARALTSA